MADYTLREVKTYPGSVEKAFSAVELAVNGLQGKVLKKSLQDGKMKLWFDKTIHGQVLGDRTQMEVVIVESTPGTIQVSIEAYPVDPVGGKLMFGVRKGVTQTVLGWFIAHLDHQMAPAGQASA